MVGWFWTHRLVSLPANLRPDQFADRTAVCFVSASGTSSGTQGANKRSESYGQTVLAFSIVIFREQAPIC
jgi:hypothetical protein